MRGEVELLIVIHKYLVNTGRCPHFFYIPNYNLGLTHSITTECGLNFHASQ